MKYIFLNDLNNFAYKYKIYLLFYIFLIVSFIIFENMVGVEMNKDLFLNSVGLIGENVGILTILMSLLSICIHLFITINLFENDLEYGQENIFLRMNKTKWIILKLLSIFIFNALLNIIVYLVVGTIFNFNINNILLYFILNLIYYMFIEYVFLLIYIIWKKVKWIFLLPIVFIIFFVKKIYIDIYQINSNVLLITVASVIAIILIIIINKKRYINIFE